MIPKGLSGIERELVLQYLIDGNVPVVITPVEENNLEEIQNMTSEIIPVSIPAEHISVLKEGIILLENITSVDKFIGKPVRVEFYFNSVGLFFETEMKSVSSGPALVIPSVINRIIDVQINKKYDVRAQMYYSLEAASGNFFDCIPAAGVELFSRPAWSSIQLEKQVKAKEYLEQFVVKAHENGQAGNGIQLINICRFLVQDNYERVEAVQNRIKPFEILFINHERIVLGCISNDAVKISEGNEYAFKMSFSLKDTPAITRDIFVTARVDLIYQDESGKRFCCDCSYTSLQEEDCRFLYEKATSSLFI